jgi:hypothetical protein
MSHGCYHHRYSKSFDSPTADSFVGGTSNQLHPYHRSPFILCLSSSSSSSSPPPLPLLAPLFPHTRRDAASICRFWVPSTRHALISSPQRRLSRPLVLPPSLSISLPPSLPSPQTILPSFCIPCSLQLRIGRWEGNIWHVGRLIHVLLRVVDPQLQPPLGCIIVHCTYFFVYKVPKV